MIEDFNSLEEEPLEPEIVVRRTGAEEPEQRSRGWRRLVPEMSETTARVVVAIPWGSSRSRSSPSAGSSSPWR